ncbi:hypothetical protein F1188_05990 [Roseospira marina]|uniref:Uncharacterized protein n=1 Tax=Roseospira marina TaxID=140057 RepID=A0A5M6IEL8_9PROT|nr:hypothetical protein [Roseospira marina]KAA5606417.1 hypothetical protein F1188_05990 [Roseospira marina]MBB4314170.1 hypothetical protein [Roseospira marina]MBB5087331.1 hypothetical protein [Roseospira marina]
MSQPDPNPNAPPLWKMIVGTVVALGASAAIVIYLDSISEKTGTAPDEAAGPVDGWTTELPEQFAGTWVVGGACDSDSAPLIVLSNGGYRWRDGPTNWGFARGRYRYESPVTNRIEFRLNKLNSPHSGTTDYTITVSGIELKKYNLKSGTITEYEKCE